MTETYGSWPEKYAAACRQLRDLFAGEDAKPMIFFDRADGLEAYQIDENGRVHRVHTAFGWIVHEAEEGRVIASGDVPARSGAEFIGEDEQNSMDAVEDAFARVNENILRDNERRNHAAGR